MSLYHPPRHFPPSTTLPTLPSTMNKRPPIKTGGLSHRPTRAERKEKSLSLPLAPPPNSLGVSPSKKSFLSSVISQIQSISWWTVISEIFTLFLSVFDIFSDCLITYGYYINGHEFYFKVSLFILLTAQTFYSLLFLMVFQTKGKWKKQILTFFLIFPFAQCVPLLVYIQSFHFSLLDSLFRSLGLDTRPTVNSPLGTFDVSKMKFDFQWDPNQQTHVMVFIDEEGNRIYPSQMLSKYFVNKFATHGGFLVEGAVESLPQSVLQIAFLCTVGNNTENLNFIYFASFFLSVFSIASKGYFISQSIEFKNFIFNFLCVIVDLIAIFAVVGFYFNPHKDAFQSFLSDLMWKKYVYLACAVLFFAFCAFLFFWTLESKTRGWWIFNPRGTPFSLNRWVKNFISFWRDASQNEWKNRVTFVSAAVFFLIIGLLALGPFLLLLEAVKFILIPLILFKSLDDPMFTKIGLLKPFFNWLYGREHYDYHTKGLSWIDNQREIFKKILIVQQQLTASHLRKLGREYKRTGYTDGPDPSEWRLDTDRPVNYVPGGSNVYVGNYQGFAPNPPPSANLWQYEQPWKLMMRQTIQSFGPLEFMRINNISPQSMIFGIKKNIMSEMQSFRNRYPMGRLPPHMDKINIFILSLLFISVFLFGIFELFTVAYPIISFIWGITFSKNSLPILPFYLGLFLFITHVFLFIFGVPTVLFRIHYLMSPFCQYQFESITWDQIEKTVNERYETPRTMKMAAVILYRVNDHYNAKSPIKRSFHPHILNKILEYSYDKRDIKGFGFGWQNTKERGIYELNESKFRFPFIGSVAKRWMETQENLFRKKLKIEEIPMEEKKEKSLLLKEILKEKGEKEKKEREEKETIIPKMSPLSSKYALVIGNEEFDDLSKPPQKNPLIVGW